MPRVPSPVRAAPALAVLALVALLPSAASARTEGAPSFPRERRTSASPRAESDAAPRPKRDAKPKPARDGKGGGDASKPEKKPAPGDALVIRAGTIHVGDGRVFSPGVLVVVDGKVTEVGEKVAEPAGARTWALDDAVLTPGFVDASVVVPGADSSGRSQADAPALDAADARSPWDPWLPLVRDEGVVAVCLVPGGAGAVTGRAATIGTEGPGAGGAPVLRAAAALATSLVGPERGSGARAAARESLSRLLESAEEYQKRWKEWREQEEERERSKGRPAAPDSPKKKELKKPDHSPGREVLLQVLEKKLPLRVRVERQEEALAALDLAKARGVPLTLAGCGECGPLAAQLAESQAVVALAPWRRPLRDDARGEPDLDLVRSLADAGVKLAVSAELGWPEGPSWLRAAAADLVGLGASPAQALAAITGHAAEAAGVGAELGTLAPGRRALFLQWDGDPLAARARVLRRVEPDDTKPPKEAAK